MTIAIAPCDGNLAFKGTLQWVKLAVLRSATLRVLLDKLHREEIMKISARSILLAAAAIAAGRWLMAEASAESVKIGVLNDQSGVYADFGGKWSVEAAKMAIEDFGGSVFGEKIELINADHQNKVDLATAIARRWYDVEGHRPDLVRGRACGAADRWREEEDRYRCGLSDIGDHGRGVHALRLPLGL